MGKRNIAVIFGGRSNEHEISCLSVANVAACIDRDKWDIYLIGITKEGTWLYTDSIESIRDSGWLGSSVRACILPDAERKCLLLEDTDGKQREIKLDAAFPVLHGKTGEDGTIQGLFELAGIPYVGCGVLSSAVCMDKFYTKLIAASAGIRQAAYVGVRSRELRDKASLNGIILRAEERLGYPVFIKPSRAGSSTGVTKAANRQELLQGLKKAAAVDSKILIEEYIKGRELECAVFGGGNKKVCASGVGEILAAAEFYDYDAKYNNPDSRTDTAPALPEGAEERIRENAKAVFNAVDGYGLARVDFFLKPDGEVVFNEINTMPGFTAISMYPMLWEQRGISREELVNGLIESALLRELLA